MTWWHAVTGAAERREKPRESGSRKSVRERFRDLIFAGEPPEPAGPQKLIVRGEHIVGYEVGGRFIPAKPCCDNPLRCSREECWTRLAGEDNPDRWDW